MKKLLFLMIPVLLMGCTKKNEPAQTLDDSNLTECPSGNCNFLFTEQADLQENKTFMTGAYRLFWASQQQDGVTTTVYVKAPMGGDTFSLDKAAILSGKVVFERNCPACFSIPFQLVDGYVKGRNASPEKPADQTRWLVETKLYLQAVNNAQLKDTIYLKQYFRPNFAAN
ncbi:hypothetical protein [Mucilaginibacter segetis]|uniref:Lipoprotein n=1 Tax=Mucilaginibacter segetis TaxID=2793071 RepID=A0A934PUE9_9SPHI|nr:hypothetical protein [Mucilaginibacter segetis]MBK0379213.1 hypothetical protein [Mucilaginibacter segetis]